MTETTTFTQEWQAWHQQHQDDLAAPHGFLAITAIHWLSGEEQRFTGIPGSWSTDAAGVHVRLDGGEELRDGADVIRGEHDLGLIPERGGHDVQFGDIVIEIARRGGYDILRPRDPQNPLRVDFRGTPAYEPNPDWVVAGRYVPFPEPKDVTVGAAVEGLQHVYSSPGRVEFEVDGRTHSLTTWDGKNPGDLSVLFTDRTSGVTTYAANRSLQIPAPDSGGRVILDFNRAANLPCAYTDLATCPLPPEENRLDFAVEAGEQIPYERR
ncbi:MAG TPA: DUF1684 domain-containing protein [Mycobacteriales bacterium]|nr:DUF1684 domain-containing protein [Mycobacteriales bacterium]